MKKFTVADYKKAIKGSGPKTTENILLRAVDDPNIKFEDLIILEEYAEKYGYKETL